MSIKDYKIFNLGDIELLSGEILKSAKLAYKSYGSLNDKKDNVVLLPTFYTGTHKRNEGFFGNNRAINPDKHFVISINMFGNGLSSSPSNSLIPQNGINFPKITLWDNVYCQNRLLIEEFELSLYNRSTLFLICLLLMPLILILLLLLLTLNELSPFPYLFFRWPNLFPNIVLLFLKIDS